MRLYFVALIPPQEVAMQITAFKNFMRAHFKTCVALRSPPHITLVPPFLFSENEEDSLIFTLNQVVTEFKMFPVVLNGFGCFKPKTIFVRVIPSVDLQKLYMACTTGFQFARSINKNYTENFHPHITIANRDLTKEKFNAAWSIFGTQEFNIFFAATQISILKHNGKSWDILQSVRFNK